MSPGRSGDPVSPELVSTERRVKAQGKSEKGALTPAEFRLK